MFRKPVKRKKKVAGIAILALAVTVLGVFGGTTAVMAVEGQVQDAKLSKEQEKKQEKVRTIYNVEKQSKIASQIEKKKKETNYTADNMLIQYNPFGTNTQSAYVYFKTSYPAKVSYTVSVSGKDIGDFTQEAYQEKEYQKEHEFQIIGLIPDRQNEVTFTITDEKGRKVVKTYAYNMGSLMGDEELQLKLDADEGERDKLSDGLYVVFNKETSQPGFMYYYDNTGTLRGEVPLTGYKNSRLLFRHNTMYYSISETQIAAVNRLGQAVAVYNLGDYRLPHDYVLDGDGNILILVTDSKKDSVEDVIVKLDTTNGQVSKVLDLGSLLGSYKGTCVKNADGKLDWIHLNSIQWMGKGQILLSSRETSTIIKISDLYGSSKIDYMLGADKFWAGTGYENLLLAKQGKFTIQGGQNSIIYVPDGTRKAGQYYLYLYDNNIGCSTSRPNFDWSSVGLPGNRAKGGNTSYCYKYLVDEKNRTFRLADSFQVPFSYYGGSVQNVDGHIIAASNDAGGFGEYDENHHLIANYRTDAEPNIYRVYKYPIGSM